MFRSGSNAQLFVLLHHGCVACNVSKYNGCQLTHSGSGVEPKLPTPCGPVKLSDHSQLNYFSRYFVDDLTFYRVAHFLLLKDQISYNDTPVYTKLSVQTPVTEDLGLPSDACYLFIEDGDGRLLAMNINLSASKGTVILSTCGMTVGNLISEEVQGFMDTIIVHFNQDLLEECFEGEKPQLWEELQKPINEYVAQTAASELVKLYFDSVTRLFENKAAATGNLLKLKLKEIILLLLQTDNAEQVRQIIKSLFSQRTFSFKEVIDAHVLTRATVENLAQLTGLSLSTFKRKFKETCQTSPAQYILEKRLNKVAECLRVTDDPVSHIGYSLGFESPEHLSRAFKRHFGVTPYAYRLNQLVK